MKPVAVLPLHVWDRELDSRLHIAYILLQCGYDVLVGHEYTLASLYDKGVPFFHFGAGRPIQNHPRSTSWYPNILNSGGFVGLCYEEGINDLESGAESHFAGISHEAVTNFSKLYGWSKGEVSLASSICPSIPSRRLLETKYHLAFNTRFEILTSLLGRPYFSRRANSIKQMFGNYVLISDNFGLEAYGAKTSLSQASNVRQFDMSEDSKNELLNKEALAVEKTRGVRGKFVTCIKHLAKELPDHNFLLRPHPVADPRFWYEELSGLRNVTTLYKDSCEPWLFSTSAVIHSGCTLGIQSFFTGTPTIDISSLIGDHRNGISSQFATTQASSLDHLVATVRNTCLDYQPANSVDLSSLYDVDMISFFNSNVESSGINEFNENLNNDLRLSKKSMILTLNTDSNAAKNKNVEAWSRLSNESFYECLRCLPRLAPNFNKSRYFSLSDKI